MKIALAQIQPVSADVEKNIRKHLDYILVAAQYGCHLIEFPELSLTGYEPKLAEKPATHSLDERFQVFQELSNQHQITICAGMPLTSANGIYIGMLIFQPDTPVQTYGKQLLHTDELPYFVAGKEQAFINIKGFKIAPAICYESLQPSHIANAVHNGTRIYMASVAKSAKGIEKAFTYYPTVAAQYHLTVLMVNCVGSCDNFIAYGHSAVWDANGNLISGLDANTEGILVHDIISQETGTYYLP